MGKGGTLLDKETAERLRKEHPNFMSPKDAAPFLGMSARKLSELVAEGRAPYHQLGGNIGVTKRIVLIYTERLIAYLNGQPLE